MITKERSRIWPPVRRQIFPMTRIAPVSFTCMFVSALAIALLWPGCKRASDSIPKGAFAYTSFDSSGTAVANGWFTMNVADSATVSGEWHFAPIGDPLRIGPQTGEGELVGGINSGKVWMELNHKVRNNNLQLNGILAEGRINGQWTWINYEGIANQGTFSAVRR